MKNSMVLGFSHNGINCIQNTAAERPCDKVWFTANQIETWSGMSKKTLWRRLQKLEEVGRISIVSDLTQWEMPLPQGGSKPTTIYNLNVLNQLAMVELDCPVLNETAKKFSDILSEVETTGSYNSYLNSFPIPTTFEDALILAGQQMKLAKEQERLRLQAEEEKVKAESERDEAVRTKYLFVEGRDAKLSGKIGGLTRANNSLRAQNGSLKNERFSVRDVVAINFSRQLTTYALSTCRSKVSKALQVLSAQLSLSIYRDIVVIDGIERSTPYYHKDVVDYLLEKLTESKDFLKPF